MAKFHDFKITSNGPVFKGSNTHVYMDGEELQGVRAIQLNLDAWDTSVIRIELYVNSIDVDAPAILELANADVSESQDVTGITR